MPCVQADAAQERKLYIEQNRRDLNEFEGITDPVEVLKIIHQDRKWDPLINWIPHPTSTDRLFAELTDEQQRRLAQYAVTLIGGERNDEAEAIVLGLAAFTHAPLEICLEALVAHGEFQSSLAFHRATPAIRD